MVRNRDGSLQRPSIAVGDLNQIRRLIYEDVNQSVDISYDPSGRPSAFDLGIERVKLRYNEWGVADSFVFASTGQVQALGQEGKDADERDRVLFDSRLSVLARDSHGPDQPDYGILVFGETTFDAIILDPIELGVPGLADARKLLQVATPLFRGRDTGASIPQFQKPSNPMFQSNEYRSVNCCIPCLTCGCLDYNDCHCTPTPTKYCKAVDDYSDFANCDAGLFQVRAKNIDVNQCSSPVPTTDNTSTFEGACDIHDICYNTCGASKSGCDWDFLVNMKSACRVKYNSISQLPRLAICLADAEISYGAVVFLEVIPTRFSAKSSTATVVIGYISYETDYLRYIYAR